MVKRPTKDEREQAERAAHIAKMESLRPKWGDFMKTVNHDEFSDLRDFVEYIWGNRNHEQAYTDLTET